jgi:hypothetical protein
MNTINTFYCDKEINIASIFQSKITQFQREMIIDFEYAFNISLEKTLLQTVLKELSALSKFTNTFWIGVDDELSFIVVSENQSRMDITYKRSLTFTNDSNIDAEYSIRHFITILKNLKSNEPIIIIATNKLMIIQDSYNTYTLPDMDSD